MTAQVITLSNGLQSYITSLMGSTRTQGSAQTTGTTSATSHPIQVNLFSTGSWIGLYNDTQPNQPIAQYLSPAAINADRNPNSPDPQTGSTSTIQNLTMPGPITWAAPGKWPGSPQPATTATQNALGNGPAYGTFQVSPPDANGYVNVSGFTEVYPFFSGQITRMVIAGPAISTASNGGDISRNYAGGSTSYITSPGYVGNQLGMTLVVSEQNASGTDIVMANTQATTNQPFLLQGTFRFIVGNSYNYTT